MRLTQQKAAYAAEAEVSNGTTFSSLEAIQEHLDGLRDEDWWPEEIIRVEVGPTHLKSSVGWYDDDACAGRIELVPNHMNQLNVCHELAHVLADYAGSTSHDPEWARQYLILVYRIMGTEAWVALRSAFERHEVVFDPQDDV